MGFKFRRRIKIAPGVHINIGKNGITSATIGKAGASVNIGKRGVKTTAGIPGTGLSYTSGNLLSTGNKGAAGSHENDSGQDQLQIPLVLTNKQYRTLSKEEKKAFKIAGGKVKLSKNEKIIIFIVIILGIGWLSDKHSPAESHKTQETQIKSLNN